MAINFNQFQASNTLTEKQKKRDEYENLVANYGDFKASDYLNSAESLKKDAENAVNNYGDFVYKNQEALNNAMNNYLNRKEFSFDLNAEALYQQYKDNYMSQGNLAMMDTMGQAAAMTGGFGNSYAATVGNQAYQGHLTKLNEIAPQLYQMALDKYNQEGQDILQRYSLLTDDRANEYGMWNDVYNKLLAERDYAGTNYNNTYNKEYGEYNDAYNRTKDAYSLYDAAYNNLYNQEYTQHSENIANQKWNAEYDLSKRSADQSATINALRNQLNQQNNNAILYDEVDYIKSNMVDGPTFTAKSTDNKHAGKGEGNFKYNGKTYYKYADYVEAYLRDAYKSGKISTAGTLNFLLDEYGL